jgi:hypothetical protein
MVANAEKACMVRAKDQCIFDGKWKDYRSLVEGTKVNCLKIISRFNNN